VLAAGMESPPRRPDVSPWAKCGAAAALPSLAPPESPAAHDARGTERTPPAFFTGSVAALRRGRSPAATSGSSSDSGAVESPPCSATAVLYNPLLDAYADCLGAAARARLAPSPSPSSSEADEPEPLSKQAASAAEAARSGRRRRRRRRARTPWVAVGRVPHPRVAAERPELGRVAAELRVAFRRALDRLEGEPHRRAALEIVDVLLGEHGAPVGDGGSGERGSWPALAKAAMARDAGATPRLRRVLEARADACLACDAAAGGGRGGGQFPPSRDDIVRRAAACGRAYRALSLFVGAHGGGNGGSVLRAAALYVSSVLDHYADTLLARLEQDADAAAAPVTAWSLLIDAEELADDIVLLSRAAALLEETRGTASEVLDVLYRLAYRHSADQVAYKLFLAAALPYLRVLWDWMFSASCARDGRGEFFGTVLGSSVDGSEELCRVADGGGGAAGGGDAAPLYPSFLGGDLVLRILRAGRARALLATVHPQHPLLGVETPSFDGCFLAGSVALCDLELLSLEMTSFIARVEEVGAASEAECGKAEAGQPMSHTGLGDDDGDDDDGDDGGGGAAPAAAVSPFVESSPVGSFRFPDDDGEGRPPSGLPRRCGLALWSPRAVSGRRERPVRGEFEAGWPPLAQLVEQLVVSPLERVDVLVQRLVFRYFTDTLQVGSHLQALWRYVLLGAGDFADVLVEQMEVASATADANEAFFAQRRASVDAPTLTRLPSAPSMAATRQRTHLAECLRAALVACGAHADPHARRIELQLDDRGDGDDTGSDDGDDGRQDAAGEPSSPSLWDRKTSVSYRAEFPLNLIISPAVMRRYSSFFNFFIRIRRASHALRRLFLTTRRQSSLRAHSTHAARALLDDAHLCTRIWRFCWEAEHFIRIVGEHEAAQVLGARGAAPDLDALAGGAADVWALRAGVAARLDAAARRALLGRRHAAVMRVVSGALDDVVQLERALAPAVDVGLRYSAAQVGGFVGVVDAAAASLQRRTKFLVVVLQKLVASGAAGAQPHLVDLLARLNYNNFY
jgi:hypothetical protein